MNLAVTPVFPTGKGESSETYPRVVAQLTDRLRVIEGQCNLQWLLQVRKSPTRWESIAFCGTKQGLLLRIRDHLQDSYHRKECKLLSLERLVLLHCEPAGWAAIEALPDYYPKVTKY